MNPSNVQAGIYRRTNDAGNDGPCSLAEQERVCRDLAATRGWEVAAVYTDEANGSRHGMAQRPAFQTLLQDVAAGRVSVVLVQSLDRLGRDLALCAEILSTLQSHGVTLVPATGPALDTWATVVRLLAQDGPARQSRRPGRVQKEVRQ